MGQLVEELVLKSDNYNRNIGSAINRLEDLRRQSDKAGNGLGGLESQLGKVKGAANILTSGIGKLAGGLGVALGAAEVFNRAMKESQTVGDAVAKIQTQASEAVNYFANCLARADFSNFLSGLQDIIDKAGDVADALDDLGSAQLLFDYSNKKKVNEYEQLLMISKDLTKTEKERKEALEKARKLNQEIVNDEKEMSVKYGETAIKIIQQELSKQRKNIGTVDENFINQWFTFDKYKMRGELKKAYDDYTEQAKKLRTKAESERNKRLKELERKHAYDVGWSPSSSDKAYNSNEQKLREQATALERKRDSDRSRVIAWATSEINDETDSQLAAALQYLSKQSDMQLEAARRDFQANRAEARLEGGNKGGSGSGTGLNKKEIEAETGSIADLTNKIKLLQKAIENTADQATRLNLRSQVKELEGQIEAMSFNDRMAEMKARGLDKPVSGVPIRIVPQLPSQEEIKAKMDKLAYSLSPMGKMETYNDVSKQIGDTLAQVNAGVIGEDMAQQIIDHLNEKLQALGLKPIEVDIKAQKAINEINGIGNTIASLGDAFSGLGQAFESPELNVAGMIASAIASIIQGYATASAQSATLGPWAWAAFSLSGLAQVASVIAQIHNLSGFANGGIVGGSSYHGDNNLIRANKGEMVLTKGQQTNLFHMLDYGRNNGVSGSVQFRVQGKDLVGVLTNCNSRNLKLQ